MKKSHVGQYLLLAAGVLAAIVLVVMIVASIMATMHGSTPARTSDVVAGPYHLRVSLYDDPAHAGFALPFAIRPAQPVQGQLQYSVTTNPGPLVDATSVRASVSADSHVANAVQGDAEISVSGSWSLHITVNGPQGLGMTDVPVEATALPAVPIWLGWLVGLIPFYALVAFLIIYWRKRQPAQTMQAG